MQFGGIFFIGIIDVFEGTCAINEITGVDTYLFDDAGGYIGDMWIEVYIGNQRSMVSPAVQLIFDVGKVLCLSCTLCRESYVIGTCVDDAYTLFHTRFGFVSVRIGHRLYAYGVAPS